jgi:hypothetical protein
MELDETSGTWSIGRANLRSLQIADDSPVPNASISGDSPPETCLFALTLAVL